MPSRARSIYLGLMLAGMAAGLGAAGGCRPEYPSCETDQDCKKDPKEYCVNRECAQCRDSKDCHPGFECTGGKCSAIAGYCSEKSQCPAGQDCIGNRCRACVSDGECTSGLKCHNGECQ